MMLTIGLYMYKVCLLWFKAMLCEIQCLLLCPAQQWKLCGWATLTDESVPTAQPVYRRTALLRAVPHQIKERPYHLLGDPTHCSHPLPPSNIPLYCRDYLLHPPRLSSVWMSLEGEITCIHYRSCSEFVTRILFFCIFFIVYVWFM